MGLRSILPPHKKGTIMERVLIFIVTVAAVLCWLLFVASLIVGIANDERMLVIAPICFLYAVALTFLVKQ